jgi:uncharacterized glyoxalase superfamily protein PhnB
MVQAVPEGVHTVTPYLQVKGGARAIEFYAKAFGAQEVMRMPGPGGSVAHAEIRIGDSCVYLSDVFPPCKSPLELKGTPVFLHLYVEDCDAWFARATAAGCKVLMPLVDMFWGDRFGQVADPFGHVWSISTHKEDLTPEEMGRRGAEAMAQMAAQAAPKPRKKKAAKKKAAKAPARKAAKKPAARRPAKKAAKKSKKAARRR